MASKLVQAKMKDDLCVINVVRKVSHNGTVHREAYLTHAAADKEASYWQAPNDLYASVTVESMVLWNK